MKVLSEVLAIRVVDLSRIEPDPHAIQMVKHAFATENDLFPYEQWWERGRTHLTVAMADPMNYRVIDELGFITNANVEPVLARPSDVDLAIRKYYGSSCRGQVRRAARQSDRIIDDDDRPPRRRRRAVNTSTGEIRSPFREASWPSDRRTCRVAARQLGRAGPEDRPPLLTVVEDLAGAAGGLGASGPEPPPTCASRTVR